MSVADTGVGGIAMTEGMDIEDFFLVIADVGFSWSTVILRKWKTKQ
jgi:hypothetical protein